VKNAGTSVLLDNVEVSEPASAALLLAAVAGLAAIRRGVS
jgi:MYXO-CTERM domain-containing protein